MNREIPKGDAFWKICPDLQHVHCDHLKHIIPEEKPEAEKERNNRKETRSRHPQMARPQHGAALMSSNIKGCIQRHEQTARNQDRPKESGPWNRMSRACKNARTIGRVPKPTCKAERTKEEVGLSRRQIWGNVHLQYIPFFLTMKEKALQTGTGSTCAHTFKGNLKSKRDQLTITWGRPC